MNNKNLKGKTSVFFVVESAPLAANMSTPAGPKTVV